MPTYLIDNSLAKAASAFLLTLARIGGVVAFTPIPGFRNVPVAVRAFLALTLSIVLFDLRAAGALRETSLLTALPVECGIGVCYGLATALLFEGFQLGAQMVGLQAGFSYASTLDPSSQADSTVISVLVFLATGWLFFATDLHHMLIRALADGLVATSVGRGHLALRSISGTIQIGSDVFRVGLKLAAPVSAIMLTIDIGLALFSRMQAQLQITTLSFPVKILVALVVLSTTVLAMGRLMRASAGSWSALLHTFGN